MRNRNAGRLARKTALYVAVLGHPPCRHDFSCLLSQGTYPQANRYSSRTDPLREKRRLRVMEVRGKTYPLSGVGLIFGNAARSRS